MELELPGGKKMNFKPTVTGWESERFFQWYGKVGFRGIFDGKHSFRLTPTEHGTRFEHSERFTGILGWMMSGKMRRRTETGFRAMNDASRRAARTPPPSCSSALPCPGPVSRRTARRWSRFHQTARTAPRPSPQRIAQSPCR